ncbi:MAG TPA: hypothetical protein VG826_29090 [Pirellulales bacterium]|nr:hypothetical protein [Pirellulales bacterium]
MTRISAADGQQRLLEWQLRQSMQGGESITRALAVVISGRSRRTMPEQSEVRWLVATARAVARELGKPDAIEGLG